MKKLIKLSAPWCGPCSQLTMTLLDIDVDAFGYELVAVNIDEDPETTAKYKVRSIPTLIIEDEEGNELARHVGSKSKSELERWLVQF